MTKNRALTKPMSNFFILKLLLMIILAGCNQQTPTPHVSPSPEIITVVVTSVLSNPQVETPDPTETPTLEAKEREEPETIVTIIVTATPTPPPTPTYTPSPTPPPPSPEEPVDPPTPDEMNCVPQPATEALGIDALYPIATTCGPGQTWTADLWVQPKGGDCCYKYYIDGNWKAGPTAKGVSIHFNLSSCGNVVGTVNVQDAGGQIFSQGFFIPAPSCCGN